MSNECTYRLITPGSGNVNFADYPADDDNTLRIKAMLAKWLRMQNVVALTGAGCSVSAGGCLMSSPNEKINLGWRVLNSLAKSKLPPASLKLVKSKIKDKDISFEKWLGILTSVLAQHKEEELLVKSTTLHLHGSEQDSITIPKKRTREAKLPHYIRRAIYYECALELDRNELTNKKNGSTGHLPFLSKLIARDSRLGRFHLFTLNYDTLFEQALDELRIQYFDGFSGKTSARFDPSVYRLDMHHHADITDKGIRGYDKFLYFYKLHGSIHWKLNKNGVCTALHKDLSSAKNYRNSSLAEKAQLLSEDPMFHTDDFGILPLSQNISQSLNLPYTELFRLFQERLARPKTFFMVIGYGFNDEHVNRIIEGALTNPSLVLLVVEPNHSSSVIDKICYYQSLGQQAYVLTSNTDREGIATFADFSQNLLPNVKWLEELHSTRKVENELRDLIKRSR